MNSSIIDIFNNGSLSASEKIEALQVAMPSWCFSYLPPKHPVMVAAASEVNFPCKKRTPWVFVDWLSMPVNYWWVRETHVSNTWVKCEGETGESRVFLDTLSLTFSSVVINGSMRIDEKGKLIRSYGYGKDASGKIVLSEGERWAMFYDSLLCGTGLKVGAALHKKNNGFQDSIALYDCNGITVGYIAYGGDVMRGRSQLYISGAGCFVLNETDGENPNGMSVFYGRLRSIVQNFEGSNAGTVDNPNIVSEVVRVKRADLAMDDFDGKVTVDDVRKAHLSGEFNGRGRRPVGDRRGDWEENHSRTYYVGSRSSRIYHRSYEKGHEQGDMSSPWVRHETEMKPCKSQGYHVPLDIIQFPENYFAGISDFHSSLLSGVKPIIIQRVLAEKAKTCATAAIAWIKKQAGLWLNYFNQVHKLEPDQIFELLVRREGRLPQRLNSEAVGSTGEAIRALLVPF